MGRLEARAEDALELEGGRLVREVGGFAKDSAAAAWDREGAAVLRGDFQRHVAELPPGTVR
eukprot:9749141-Alexandrium_andersonii.AAC.1